MEIETPPPEKPPSQNKGKIIFQFLAFVPLPIGLLLDPLRLLNAATSNQSKGPFIAFNAFTLICCVAGGIGMCGGFKNGKWKGRLGGIGIGLVLWVVEVSVIFSIGCCKGLGQMH